MTLFFGGRLVIIIYELLIRYQVLGTLKKAFRLFLRIAEDAKARYHQRSPFIGSDTIRHRVDSLVLVEVATQLFDSGPHCRCD